ncbi:MAG: Hsp33 family molecular chaperone HslO [Gammaproteobacteria bacterium]|nr:Hsp33 family molecular chaperone HslO [Gammaproteobacteria bacterium]NND55226.1 Hsp33 family molecular chaperone HslO [Gammaproteobacteria bacterium]
MADDNDTLRRFLFEKEEIRGSIVRLDSVWQELRTAEDYPAEVVALLGESLAATTLLGRNLKFHGRMTLQVQGGAHVRLLVLQCDNQLRVRGLAHFGDDLPHTFTELVDGGALCITVESGKDHDRYQSIVPLSEIDLAACLELYYRQSVQLPTVFLLAADEERAAGLMLQALPERVSGGGGWQRLTSAIQGLDVMRMSRLGDETLLSAVFPEEDIRLFDADPVEFHCDCSMERIENMLRMLGPHELVDLVSEQNTVEVRCEFCNQAYEVGSERVFAMAAELSGSSGKQVH